ncbi:SoxR reducing system RseC family protein [Caenibacillus caldisaponilyticus]|uniref:SoxR reducing system RseC family protein n=1 Tax=Caenibacillus caldisaponilyticus TaxID=1674942 RepID=UPI00098845D2|nr:SoxR reducing system RseC family protein [Caenibacillus caldisaponilyticus]
MKNLLLHTVPVIVLALAAIFGLSAEEQNELTQALTALIGAVFAIVPIVVHHRERKKNENQ